MIVCDMDGVLVSFVKAAYQVHGRLHEYVEGETPTHWGFFEDWGITEGEFWEPIHRAGAQFWAGLEVTPDGHSLIQILKSKKYGEFCIATQPSQHPSSHAGKMASLIKHFGPDFHDYFLTGCKGVLGQPGWLLIDDAEKNCDRFIAAGGDAILFPAPWNKNREHTNRAFAYVMDELFAWSRRRRGNRLTNAIEELDLPAMYRGGPTKAYSVYGPRQEAYKPDLDVLPFAQGISVTSCAPGLEVQETIKTGEVDPLGMDQHAPGAKLDAGKSRVHLCLSSFASAIEAVADITTYGAKKYTPNGWREVPDGINRYLDAMGRHYLKYCRGEMYDTESGRRHLAHWAWNALAVLQLEIERERTLKNDNAAANTVGDVSGLREAMRIKKGSCVGSSCRTGSDMRNGEADKQAV